MQVENDDESHSINAHSAKKINAIMDGLSIRSRRRYRDCCDCVPELKLGNIQRKILRADVVECANGAALEDTPEGFNRVRVHCADNVLMFVVIDRAVRVRSWQASVSGPRIGCQRDDFVGNRFGNKRDDGIASGALQHAGNDIALALHGTDDGYLAVVAFLFVPVTVLVVSADVGFINLDNAA